MESTKQERIRSLKWSISGNLTHIKYPCIVDIKYDGMPVHVTYRAGTPPLLTSEAGVEYSLPHCDIMAKEVAHAEFIAEWIHKDGKNGSIWPLLSVASHKKAISSTTIKIFDILNRNGIDERMKSLSHRLHIVKLLIKPQFCAQSWNVGNVDQLLTIAQDMQTEGYEGIIVKNIHEYLPLQTWVKLKSPGFLEVFVTKVEVARIEITYNGINIGLALPGFPVKVGNLIKIKHYGVTPRGSLRNAIALKNLSK